MKYYSSPIQYLASIRLGHKGKKIYDATPAPFFTWRTSAHRKENKKKKEKRRKNFSHEEGKRGRERTNGDHRSMT